MMAIVLSTSTRNAMADALAARLNGGKIRFFTAADAVVAEVSLASPAFAPAAGGTITSNEIGDATAAAGVVTKYQAVASNGDLVLSGSVTNREGNGDIKMGRTDFLGGEKLEDSEPLTYTVPASA